MSKIISRHSMLLRDERGGVAIVFGLTSLVLFGIIGASVDVGRAYATRTVLQNAADATALSIVKDGAAADPELGNAYIQDARARAEKLGSTGFTSQRNWLSETDVEIRLDANLETMILGAVPGMPQVLNISVRAVARSHKLKLTAAPPSKIDLSYEAGDYNQVWAYCYDRNWAVNGTRESDEGTEFRSPSGNLAFTQQVAARENRKGRADFTLIADNGASPITFEMPDCVEGETLSYMLFNSRNNRTSPSNWKKNADKCGTALSHTGKSCYTWYTDTSMTSTGIELHSGTSPYQVEATVCEDSNCNTLTAGGTLPGNNKRHRIPRTPENVCEPGKFMFFGWEDRPPQNQGGNGTGAPYAVGKSDPGGDRDYDDIRLIVSCPIYEKISEQVRLIE